jgi:hypothetical protein
MTSGMGLCLLNWEVLGKNGYVESFIGTPRDALLNGDIFGTLLGARVPQSDGKPPPPEAYGAGNFYIKVAH